MANSESRHWYKDAIIYQAHVRSFQDSNGDGIGDFKGLITRLDYLKSLGINALWLLPFYRSPLKDGGYDISDFTGINPDYGTLADFKRLIREAHKRDIRIITELVLNHTSSEHRWFERAVKAKPGTVNRNYYVWSDNTEKYKEARIIFQDFEISNWTWNPDAKAYYWHRFYSHQPDLNFENPRVYQEILKILDFWFNMGVDGLRLDAVPYLFEKDGTNCENLPETHKLLKKLRKYIDENHQDKMLLAEANQWPDDASAYFGNGDECHMCFHFPLMPRLYMSMRMEDRFPLIDILEQTPEIPDTCQWAIFLRNHDELTLEMVSDEERDYMYRSFAKNPRQRINLGIRRRLAPLLDNDRKNIEMLNILLFSLPGTPIIYYGDEIGMGDNYYLGDRDGVRTPMQWTSDRNAGFSTAEPQQLFLPVIYNPDYHYESINVENQEKNLSSLLWWMRRLIAIRKEYAAFSRGEIKFIESNNPKILTFTRKFEDEIILVIVNLSRYAQQVKLDLGKYAGYIPTEVFSRNEFSIIGKNLYEFPLQYKNYFWFELRRAEEHESAETGRLDYKLTCSSREWNQMNESLRHSLRELLLEYVKKNRWFRGKARKIKDLVIIETIPFETCELNAYILLIQILYTEGKNEYYVIPLALTRGGEAMDLARRNREAIITDLVLDGRDGLLYDGSYCQGFRDTLFSLIHQRGKRKSKSGEVAGLPGRKFSTRVSKDELPLPSRVLTAEQSNTSIMYDNRFFFKLYRNPEEGKNPEVEILKALTEHTGFRQIPVYSGTLEFRGTATGNMALGILVEFVPNQGNAWDFVQHSIEPFFERARSAMAEFSDADADRYIKGKELMPTEKILEMLDPFFIEMVQLMARRTAEMHLALASIDQDKEFQAEPFSVLYQKSLYQSFRTLIKRTISEMKSYQHKMNEVQNALLDGIIENEGVLLSTIKETLEKTKIQTSKIRVHGDYHLGQVLFTGKDFIIIDFEGEPIRSLTARSLKYCPFKDVAGMLRSFHYAIYMGHMEFNKKVPGSSGPLEMWLEPWHSAVVEIFINSYVETAGKASFMPEEDRQRTDLISLYTIEKAIYEAEYELNNRPDWLHIPLYGLNRILTEMVSQLK